MKIRSKSTIGVLFFVVFSTGVNVQRPETYLVSVIYEGGVFDDSGLPLLSGDVRFWLLGELETVTSNFGQGGKH